MLLKRTLLLKDEPAGRLQSLAELFALANAMEQEAADRYGALAGAMRDQGRAELADVFARLAEAEREHVDSVAKWSRSRTGHAPDATLVRWQAPEAVAPEDAAEIETSQLMTPYRALALAVRNEERAFAFWSYVAAFGDDPDIKAAAETMAREELGHVATLRRERRRAYHRAQTSGAAPVSPDQITAAELERRVAEQLGAMADTLAGPAAARTRELAREALGMADKAPATARLPAHLAQADLPALSEALSEAYLEGADRTADPDELGLLQTLAGQAIARLAWLRALR